MRKQIFISNKLLLVMSLILLSATLSMAASGDAQLAEPVQKEKFFAPERLSLITTPGSEKTVVEPYLSVSHDAREEDVGLGVKQTSEKVRGEAGGKLNLLGDISLTTFAKIPVYSKETVGSLKTSDGASNSELLKNTGRLSWRSELGVPVKKGVDLNFFYDNSTVGKIDKPGVDEREEKFGTRFIFKFE